MLTGPSDKQNVQRYKVKTAPLFEISTLHVALMQFET